MSEEVSAIQIARKQRHIYLLGKVKQNQPLSAGEMKELQRYESDMPKRAGDTTQPVTPYRSGVVHSEINAAQVKALALHHEFLVDAAAAANTQPSLTELIEQRADLAEAWERGQLLRRLKACAGTDLSVSETARKLGIEPQVLVEMLKTDAEARQVWKEARIQLAITVRTAFVELVKSGQVSATAVSRIANILRAEFDQDDCSAGGPDIEHVPIQTAAQLCGVSRQTLHTWHREKGLARSSDGTYNLKVLVPWLVKWTEARMLDGPGTATVTDLLRYERGLEIRQRRLEREGYLVDSREVTKGLLSREQAVLDAQRRYGEDLARQMEGMNADQRLVAIRECFERQRVERTRLPDQLHLPPGARELLERLLTLLEPNEDESSKLEIRNKHEIPMTQ